jgi:hypothetical protein
MNVHLLGVCLLREGFKNYIRSPNFRTPFVVGKCYVLILIKTVRWATFWATFSKLIWLPQKNNTIASIDVFKH